MNTTNLMAKLSEIPCHFLALGAIFLGLVSFSTTIYLFHLYTSYYHQFLSTYLKPDSVLYLILFAIFYFVPLTIDITFQKSPDRAIKLASSIKTVIASFLPLLSPDYLVRMIMLGLIFFASAILRLLQYTMLVLLGCNMDYTSIYSLGLIFFASAILRIMTFCAGLLVYFGVEESILIDQTEFSPSKNLAKGMRVVTFLMLTFYGFVSGILPAWFTFMMANADNNFHGGPTGWQVVQILVYAVFMLTLLLCNDVVENVLLHLLYSELTTSQIDEKSGEETECLKV